MRTPRIFLHVVIPGEPQAQARHRWGKGRIYDPSQPAKEIFHGELQAACPTLKPEMEARMVVQLTIWTDRHYRVNEDVDNFLKFYMDAMSPPRIKRNLREKIDMSKAFAVWGNDSQVDKAYVEIHRSATNPRVEIMVYELLPESSCSAGHLETQSEAKGETQP